jgi:hypothetical protein
MKITRKTPEQLILERMPWLLGSAFIAAILIFDGIGLTMLSYGGDLYMKLMGGGFILLGTALGGMMFCVFVRRVQVILDRPGDRILIRRQSVFGFSKVEHPLADLSHAEVESTTSTDEDGRTMLLYRPVLVLASGMSAGRHPLVEAYFSGGGSDLVADAINAWLPARSPESVDSGARSA